MERITSALNRAAVSGGDALLKTNKLAKKTVWDWKQLLYAEAEANPQKALVSLSTVKAIHGEVNHS